MLESDVWKTMRPRLNYYGLATRIENAASMSVPDVTFCCDDCIFFIELKVDHQGKFAMPKYQFAYGVRLAQHVHKVRHWIALWDDELQGCRMFTFDRARSMPQEEKGEKIWFEWRTVWGNMPNHFEIVSMRSCEVWVVAVTEIAKNKK